MGFKLLTARFVITTVGFSLSIASFCVDWYRIELKNSPVLNFDCKFYWDHFAITGDNESETHKYKDGFSNIKQTFDWCLAFLVIGTAFLTGLLATNTMTWCGIMDDDNDGISYYLGRGAGGFILGSFFALLSLPKAFTNDQWGMCANPLTGGSRSHRNCGSFMGKGGYLEGTYEWAPGPAWWILFCANVFVIAAFIMGPDKKKD